MLIKIIYMFVTFLFKEIPAKLEIVLRVIVALSYNYNTCASLNNVLLSHTKTILHPFQFISSI